MFKKYHPINGQLRRLGKFNENNHDSTWTFYHQNGKVSKKQYYKLVRYWKDWMKGKNKIYYTEQRIGTWTTYDYEGNLVKEEIYKDGELIETKEY